MDVHVNGEKDEYERRKQALEEQSTELLEELAEKGIKFEWTFVKLQSFVNGIRNRTNKVIFNDRYKRLTKDQIKTLKKSEKIKKDVDVLMEHYRTKVWEKIKDIMENTDAMEISKHPWKIPFKMLFTTLKDNIKMNREFWPILKKLRKPLELSSHYKQNNYEKEFHTFFERFMWIKYHTDRSIIEKKDVFWVYWLLNYYVKDIFVLWEGWEKVSYRELKKQAKKDKKNSKQTRKEKKEAQTQRINEMIRENTSFWKNIAEIEKLKQEGKRVFVVVPHPSYLWAVMPRYALMKLGFKEVAGNWNFICGPRVLSSWIIAWWAKTIWNLWMTLPSTDTTPIKTEGLERDLRLQAVKTSKLASWNIDKVKFAVGERALYDATKGEVFVVAPEWSRSNELKDGTIDLKYCSPNVFGSFIKPGDYVVALTQTWSENVLPKWAIKPRKASIWISLWRPTEVTDEDIVKKQEAIDTVMTKVSELPSLAPIIYKTKSSSKVSQESSKEDICDPWDQFPKKNV